MLGDALTVVEVDESGLERPKLVHRPPKRRRHIVDIVPQTNLDMRLLSSRHFYGGR